MRILAIAVCLLSARIAAGESVDTILARMDAAAPSFRGLSAKIKMTTRTAILDETTTENGMFKMQRLNGGDVRAILDFSGEADSREIGFLGNIVRIYYPRLKAYQDYEIGKNIDVLNQFLLLGFGSSGKDLAAKYEVVMAGEEKVEAQDTTKLSLTPKSAEISKRLSKIDMWIPKNAAYPIQQQFYEPSGNYRVVTYSDIDLKPIKGKLELKLPSGAKKQ